MINDLKVKVGPQYYRYAVDAIDEVVKVLDAHQAKTVLIVHGTISWTKAKKYLKFLATENYRFVFHEYTGECSYYGTDLIVEKVKKEHCDFIIGVGGVKLIGVGNIGVIAVFSPIESGDLLILLGFIPAFISNPTNGSAAKLILAKP